MIFGILTVCKLLHLVVGEIERLYSWLLGSVASLLSLPPHLLYSASHLLIPKFRYLKITSYLSFFLPACSKPLSPLTGIITTVSQLVSQFLSLFSCNTVSPPSSQSHLPKALAFFFHLGHLEWKPESSLWPAWSCASLPAHHLWLTPLLSLVLLSLCARFHCGPLTRPSSFRKRLPAKSVDSGCSLVLVLLLFYIYSKTHTRLLAFAILNCTSLCVQF